MLMPEASKLAEANLPIFLSLASINLADPSYFVLVELLEIK
jgi:hypothetical protein